MAKVAGNLQSKFELVASGSASAGARANAKIELHKSSQGCADSSGETTGSDRVACRIVAAIKSPYLSESQRQTLWSTKRSENKPVFDASLQLSRATHRMERMQQCLRQYTSLLEAAIGVIGAQNATVDAHFSCLAELIRSWGGFYAALAAQPADAVKNLFASIEAAPRKLLERVVHLLLANNSQTGVMVARDSREGNEPVAAIQYTTVMAVQAFLTGSNRGFAALCAHENMHRPKGSEEQKRTDKKVKTEKEKGADLGGLTASGAIVLDGTSGNSLLRALIALLKPAAIFARDLQLQIQVVVCMENLLAKCDARFVELLLGLSATALGAQGVQGDKSLGVGEGLSGKKRRRSGSGDGSASQVNNLLPHKPIGRNASAKTGHSVTNDGVSQITPSHVRKAAARDTLGGPAVALEGGGVGHRISPATGTSAVRSISGRKLTPPTPYRDGVVQLDLQPHLASVQRALVSDLAVVWMGLIRSLDKVSSLPVPSPHAQLTVVLIMRLNALLGGIFSHLTSQDCDFVLADVADTFHEYIFRSNSSSWSVLLKMPENLFGFLESTRNTDSMG